MKIKVPHNIIILFSIVMSIALIYSIAYFINNYPDDEKFLNTQSHTFSTKQLIQYQPYQYLIDTIYTHNIIVKEIDKNPLLPVLKSSRYCIQDPYRVHPNIYRYATGQVGTFIDEKISITIPDNTNISIPLQPGDDLILDFYIVTTTKDNVPRNIKVSIKDVHCLKKIYSDIVYPYNRINPLPQISKKFSDLSNQTGWQHISVSIGNITQKAYLIFSINSSEHDGITFIGNPIIYTKNKQKKYNVIYLIFDAMAKDYIGIYNPNSKLTPFIDSLKDQWVIFDNMHTTGVKTRIFISSFLTSKLPPQTRHGVNFNYIPEDEKLLFYHDVSINTLPKELHTHNYCTFQVGNSGFSNPILITGIDYGFDMSFEYQKNPHNTTGILYHLMRTLQQVGNKPFFIYSHFNTTHKPRRTPLKYYVKGLVTHPELSWRPNATGAVLFADATFKKLYYYLKETQLLDNTIIILTADHGTAYDINHYGHNYNHKDYTDIPFLVLLPQQLAHEMNAQHYVATHCSTIDVAPTILDMLGLKIDPKFSGKSLASEISGKYNTNYTHDFIHSYDNFSYSCIFKGRWKYILLMQSKENFRHKPFLWWGHGIEEASEQLYDIKTDPNEYNNVINYYPQIVNNIRNNFLNTSYYPQLTVLSFFPDSLHNKTDNYSIHITTNGSIIKLHSLLENNLTDIPFNHNQAIINLKVQNLPQYVIIETKPAEEILNIAIFKNNKLADKDSIYYGNFNFPFHQNPIVINTHNATIFKAFSRKKEDSGITKRPFIHIMRIDTRRWIDTENLSNAGAIDTNMKQVLKSWGYIQ